jgi:acetyl esterase/lipase
VPAELSLDQTSVLRARAALTGIAGPAHTPRTVRATWFFHSSQNIATETEAADASAAADVVVLYFHGGGYAVGHPAQYIPSFARLFKELRERHAASTFAILSVDYPLAPENPHPSALCSAVAAYAWLCGRRVGGSRPSIVIAGDSAGGNLSLALAALLQGDIGTARSSMGPSIADGLPDVERLPGPEALLLVSPWLDVTVDGSSSLDKESSGTYDDASSSADYIEVSFISRLSGFYLPDRLPAKDCPDLPLLNAAHLKPSALRALVRRARADVRPDAPRLMLVAGGDELFYNSVVQFVRMTQAAGLSTKLIEHKGQPHVYPLLYPFFRMESCEALISMCDFIAAQKRDLCEPGE